MDPDHFPDPTLLDRTVHSGPIVQPLHIGRRIRAAFRDWRGLAILGAALALVILA